jgi:hypothetical protein
MKALVSYAAQAGRIHVGKGIGKIEAVRDWMDSLAKDETLSAALRAALTSKAGDLNNAINGDLRNVDDCLYAFEDFGRQQ